MVEADARNGMCFWIVENKFEIPAEKAKDFTFDTPVELLLKSAGELDWDSNGLELPVLAENFFAGLDQKFSSKPSELFGSISDEEDGNKITCLPYALKEGAGDAEIQFAWMLRGWSTALGRHVVVKNTDDTCDLYAPYDGFMLQKQTINDMKKYLSRSMFDGVIVTERDNNKKWKVLSTQERETFVEQFKDESTMDSPFAENKAASGGLLLSAVPELGEDGFETGKERTLTTDDKVIKNNNLATAALMFNPRAFAERMAVSPRTRAGTFVLELMLKHGFEEPFMKALQEFENGSELNDGSFWIKVSERDSVLDAAQHTYNPEGNTFVTVYKNFKSSHWLRFANARELETKKKFRINNGLMLTKAMEALRKEVEQERKTKAEEEKKQAVRDAFNAGGEQTVTPEILEAFGTESVLDIIRTASQKDSKVTQLSVSFKDSDEFEKALDIITDALRNDGNKVLKLNVKKISKFEPSPEEKAELDKKEEEENKRRLEMCRNLDGYRFEPLPFWLTLRYDKKIRNGIKLLATSYIDRNAIEFRVPENNEEEIPYQEDNRNTRQNNNEEEEHRSDGNEQNNQEDEPNNEDRGDGENNNEENNRQENEEEQQQNQNGNDNAEATFTLPDFRCDCLPTIWLGKNEERSEFKKLKNVYFIRKLTPEQCPKAVREALTNDFDGNYDFILDAVCYTNEDNLSSDDIIALGFGGWVPDEVSQWRTQALCLQNIDVINENNGVTVTRDDAGTADCLEFEINSEPGTANAWFVCEYAVGEEEEEEEEEEKEKRRIAVHLFFPKDRPKAVKFEKLQYPLPTAEETNAKNRKYADGRAEMLWKSLRKALVSELEKIPEPEEDKEKVFMPAENSPWTSYLRDGLLGASDLVSAVLEFNDTADGEEKKEIGKIDLWHANLFIDDDVVHFSKENIRDLKGVTVLVYNTTREEEFRELTCRQGTFLYNGESCLRLLVKGGYFQNNRQEGQNNGQDEEEGEEQNNEHQQREQDNNQQQDDEQRRNDDEERENNDGENNGEEQNENRQDDIKITKVHLENPDEATKRLFASMDLKAFLDKAKADLAVEGEDPEKDSRGAVINLAALCSNDETLKRKLDLDVLKEYPLWYYQTESDETSVWGAEDSNGLTKDVLRQACNRYEFFEHGGYLFCAYPKLHFDGIQLKIKNDRNVKYLIEEETDGFRKFAKCLGYNIPAESGTVYIDFSGITLKNSDRHDLRHFAAYPVVLTNMSLDRFEKTKVKDTPLTWKMDLTETTFLVHTETEGFKVRYEPKDIQKFGIDGRFLQNLMSGLEQAALDGFDDELQSAVASLTLEDFKNMPVAIKDDGSLIKDESKDFLDHDNKVVKDNLFDLFNGETPTDAFMDAWSKFIKETKKFDARYHKSLILFFLCWNGCDRVDFSSFSKNGFDDWQKKQNITFHRVLENKNVQAIWNDCLNTVTNIPNPDTVKTVFGNLKALCDDTAFVFKLLNIADKNIIKNFLESIKDWDGWNYTENVYVTSQRHNSALTVLEQQEVACFGLQQWKAYQQWRFKRYFIDGYSSLPNSEKKPIKACEQWYGQGGSMAWRDKCEWKSVQ